MAARFSTAAVLCRFCLWFRCLSSRSYKLFRPPIGKYRRLLGEVVAASFFLQLFALVSPLFFQVVIDKVLVHRSLSTLDVLVIGLVVVSLFDTVLGILQQWRINKIVAREAPT